MREVWASLNHSGKNWKQIFKGLTLLDALVKYGSGRVVEDARDHMYRIRTLTDYTHYEDGSDKGAGGACT
jgi:epsin